MKKLIAVLTTVTLLFAFAGAVLAADVTGKVAKTDKGFTITTDKKVAYTVAGKVDMAPFVGKTVKATGEIKDKTITVTKVAEVAAAKKPAAPKK
jgi:hypothetical protein